MAKTAKFNLNGLSYYELELIRFALYAHASNLEDIEDDLFLTAKERMSTQREMKATRGLIGSITTMLESSEI